MGGIAMGKTLRPEEELSIARYKLFFAINILIFKRNLICWLWRLEGSPSHGFQAVAKRRQRIRLKFIADFLFLIFFRNSVMENSTHCLLIHPPKRDNTPEKLVTIVYLLNNHSYSVSF